MQDELYKAAVQEFYVNLDQLRMVKDITCATSFRLKGENKISIYDASGKQIIHAKVDEDVEDADYQCYIEATEKIKRLLERRQDGRVYANYI